MEKEKEKANYWKIVTIVLAFTAVFLIVFSFTNAAEDETIEIQTDEGNITIPIVLLDKMTEVANGEPFYICSTSGNNKCITFVKQE